jgi:hypothetical protein
LNRIKFAITTITSDRNTDLTIHQPEDSVDKAITAPQCATSGLRFENAPAGRLRTNPPRRPEERQRRGALTRSSVHKGKGPSRCSIFVLGTSSVRRLCTKLKSSYQVLAMMRGGREERGEREEIEEMKEKKSQNAKRIQGIPRPNGRIGPAATSLGRWCGGPSHQNVITTREEGRSLSGVFFFFFLFSKRTNPLGFGVDYNEHTRIPSTRHAW